MVRISQLLCIHCTLPARPVIFESIKNSFALASMFISSLNTSVIRLKSTSKGAHVAVNGAVKYYVEGRKLHLLDDDQKEHSIEILKTVLRPVSPTTTETQAPAQVTATIPPSAPAASLNVDSSPSGADIEVDGAFVGNTPSAVSIAPGHHEVVVKKRGFASWSRSLNVTGGTIHLSAELEPSQQQ
jgi:hypothetical protein